ncbi:MAG: phosphoglucosamine mutase [Deltaproteobacteria bacterium]|nr:phosphoglucosamine mutase [Deltaproteobacteria bacterium]
MATQSSSSSSGSTTPTRHLFGTDGIRGVANEHPMTPELTLRLGRALTFITKSAGRRGRIVVGKDTRLSGYMLETALASGICAMGGHVMLCGPMPTPGVAQLTTSMRADAGVVISASHNPYKDNGIKIFGADGYKLDDAVEERLEQLLDGDTVDTQVVSGSAVGSAVRVDDAQGRYVVFCKSTFPARLTLEGIRIVVDAAHGAAYKVAPTVFEELGARVYPIGVKPNGRNINKTGALLPNMVAAEVVKHSAHLGIALDGDADRVIVVDERGQVVDGDVIMALCATRMLAARKLPKKTLVTTVMSNLGLEHAIQRAGGKLVRTPVGDRYVVERMRRGGFRFGGEQSGHLIFLDHATTGDGIVAALQVLAILVTEQRSLSELASGAMNHVPQLLISERLDARRPLQEMAKASKAIAACEKKLGKKGRVVVRWSGTEPKLRVMVEGENDAVLRTQARAILDAAKRDLKNG